MTSVRVLGFRSGQPLPYLIPHIAAARQKGQPVLVLVPEQYTLQAERELIRGLAVPGLMDVDVMSPRRLALAVREVAGQPPLQPLNDRGRAMVLSQVLLTAQDELPFYGKSAAQAGLPDQLGTVLRDLEQSGRDPVWLLGRAEAASSRLTRAKLTDIARLWTRYREMLADRFLDEDGQMRDTIARLPGSGLVRDTAVFVCGFDAISMPFGQMLCVIAREAAGLTVALTLCRPGDPDQRAFRGQQVALGNLCRLLEQEGLTAEVDYPPADREADPALKHLERQLFSLRPAVWNAACDALEVHVAQDPYGEARHAAQQLRLWHEAGIPWGRMSLALADPQLLENPLSVMLSAAGIPHYLARKDSAARHGLCRLLSGALRAVSTGFDQRQTLGCLDSGFSCLDDGEALALRRYAVANGIRWKKWTQPFTRGENAGEMEPLRSRFMAPLTQLRFDLEKAKDGALAAEALWQFLSAVDAYGQLQAREDALLQRGLQTEAAQNRQVWSIVLDLLDQMHSLLAGQKCGLKQLAQLVESGLAGASISALPPAPDTVMVGEAGHLLTGGVDAMILMGLQEGVTASSAQDLLTDEERTLLGEKEPMPVGMNSETRNALRYSDFYRAVTTPARFLVLSRSAGGVDGGGLSASTLLTDVRRVFPQIRVTGGVATSEAQLPLSPRLTLEELPRMLREGTLTPLWAEAWSRLLSDRRWAGRASDLAEALHARVEAGPLPGETAQVLFQQEETSISRLETFAACPFRHFVEYGLRPTVPPAFEVRPDEVGNFYHEVLCRYIRLASDHRDWPDLTPETVDALTEEALKPATAAWEDGPMAEDAVSRSDEDAYIRTVRQSIRMLTWQAQHNRFNRLSAEVEFGGNSGLPPIVLELADGRQVALRGKIDRIDRWQGDEGLCLRVVDNKKSDHKLEALKMYWGLQLQLMLYLDAASRGEQALPGGAFYFHVQDPLVESESDIREQVEQALAKAMQLSGVTLAEVSVVNAMNESAKVTTCSITKKGGFSGGLTADRAGMQHLMACQRQTAADLALRIRRGEIAISPAKLGDWSACTWCGCSGVCGLDPRLPGGDPRELDRELDTKTAWARLTGQEAVQAEEE